jgi:antirestriction protein ArdC
MKKPSHKRHPHQRRAINPHDTYQEVTDQILAELEKGVVPWERGWNQAACGAPMNPTTGRSYRGINTLILGSTQGIRFNGDPRWCSYRQAQARGWQVRKGETSTAIVFYKRCIRKEGGGEVQSGAEGRGDNQFFLLRRSRVFHVSQMDNVPVYNPPDLGSTPWRTPEAVEIILANSGARIEYGGPVACFIPSRDLIQLPPKAAFRSDAAFCYTTLHELSHHAYAAPRLNLSQGGRFGSAAYAFEELVVSIASVNICAVIGVTPEIENTASYIHGWASILKGDKKAIFRAAADAQIVADYLLAFHPDYAAQEGMAEVGSDVDDETDDAGTDFDRVTDEADQADQAELQDAA